jgi:CTP synthase
VIRKLRLHEQGPANLDRWKEFLHRLNHPQHSVRIGLVGKYIELQDAYKSIYESFIHAAAANNCKVEIINIHSETINDQNAASVLSGLSGILVAPGFGNRGVEGKIQAIRYARENKVPFLGICLGMQCAVIEFARHVLGLNNAHSTEMDHDTPHPVIDMMEEQKKVVNKGGTMRLGAYRCQLREGSLAARVYGKNEISERHRHRYEFNNQYLQAAEAAGLMASGKNPENNLVEVVELSNHPWFLGVQFHPELKSTVDNPHPLFKGLVAAAIEFDQKQKSTAAPQLAGA